MTPIAKVANGAKLKIVELPPVPPVLSSVVAEVYGRSDQSYDDLLAAAQTVAERFRREPGVADVDTITEVPVEKLVFVTDQEKAALAGISVEEIAATIRLRAVIPPARVPHALKKRRRMPIDEVNVAADGFVQQCEDAATRMQNRHGAESVGNVLEQGEDHGSHR